MNFIWTRSLAADAISKPSQTDASVSCPMCSCEIPLVGKQRLPREFSALCPNCGHRKVFLQAEVHDPKPDAAATKAPRKNQFGKKTPMQSRLMAG
jgi:DNA-directed RNA polymerase subunit RPC12/RpoP